MSRKQLAYGVLLPLQLTDRHGNESQGRLVTRFPIVSIDTATEPNPCGTRKGTILRNPRDESDAYADLAFRGFLRWTSGAMELIARKLEYQDLFSVDLVRATMMVRLLRQIQKAESEFTVTPTDFGQYVSLLGPEVGIEYMVVAEDQATEKRNHYPEGFYRIRPIRDAQHYIQNLIVALAEKHLAQVPV